MCNEKERKKQTNHATIESVFFFFVVHAKKMTDLFLRFARFFVFSLFFRFSFRPCGDVRKTKARENKHLQKR